MVHANYSYKKMDFFFLYIWEMKWREIVEKYGPYFVDVWQYIVLILIFIIAAIFIL
jgi:hypothetical protein